MRRLFLVLLLPLMLAACGSDRTWAPDDVVARARVAYPDRPPSVTLVTVIATRNGQGAHSGLVINGSERILFDPAGTFEHPGMPIRNDVHYGVTDQRLEIYYDYHARVTYYVVAQEKIVSPQVAELVIQRAKAYGAVSKAMCANSISDILRGVPGFESIRPTYFPVKLMNQFAQLGGISERKIYDDDADDNRYVVYTHTQDAQ